VLELGRGQLKHGVLPVAMQLLSARVGLFDDEHLRVRICIMTRTEGEINRNVGESQALLRFLSCTRTEGEINRNVGESQALLRF
jgi:hypothetical protein